MPAIGLAFGKPGDRSHRTSGRRVGVSAVAPHSAVVPAL